MENQEETNSNQMDNESGLLENGEIHEQLQDSQEQIEDHEDQTQQDSPVQINKRKMDNNSDFFNQPIISQGKNFQIQHILEEDSQKTSKIIDQRRKEIWDIFENKQSNLQNDQKENFHTTSPQQYEQDRQIDLSGSKYEKLLKKTSNSQNLLQLSGVLNHTKVYDPKNHEGEIRSSIKSAEMFKGSNRASMNNIKGSSAKTPQKINFDLAKSEASLQKSVTNLSNYNNNPVETSKSYLTKYVLEDQNNYGLKSVKYEKKVDIVDDYFRKYEKEKQDKKKQKPHSAFNSYLDNSGLGLAVGFKKATKVEIARKNTEKALQKSPVKSPNNQDFFKKGGRQNSEISFNQIMEKIQKQNKKPTQKAPTKNIHEIERNLNQMRIQGLNTLWGISTSKSIKR